MRRAFSQKFGRSGSHTEKGKASQEKEPAILTNKAVKRISFREPEVDNGCETNSGCISTKATRNVIRNSKTLFSAGAKRCDLQKDFGRTSCLQRSISLEDIELQVRAAVL